MDNKELLAQINAQTLPQLAPAIAYDRKHIVHLTKLLQTVLLPSYFRYDDLTQAQALTQAQQLLTKIITQLDPAAAAEVTTKFCSKLPAIKRVLLTDLAALYAGDPAAKTYAEIVLCYPGFYATLIYRLAHELYALNFPQVARVMSEYAHEKTGIDINPGATIGGRFCIDHGTGIVIGETATLGHHVKLYQGVTIGAKSFELDENGQPVKGGKRHPDIGDNVVIYANATILGGTTKIGTGCVIGGNVWITHSLPANQKVVYQMPPADKTPAQRD